MPMRQWAQVQGMLSSAGSNAPQRRPSGTSYWTTCRILIRPRSSTALSFRGYTNVKHLAAGYVGGWEEAGYPVVK